ncbi:hypothetical protein RHMOL_Rhmol13G0263900 [Rhododendron molle]|uniref:Uncharacterized protein n=1 Tax=Rhododendron molle TaxID=49168 RepID=A0ACC0LBC3_RHOML|nr:hypothetical protein RHMOL_Rhmol13G0263900 [Rhododendron molle]
MRNANGAEPTLDQRALYPVNARSTSKRSQRTQKRLPSDQRPLQPHHHSHHRTHPPPGLLIRGKSGKNEF